MRRLTLLGSALAVTLSGCGPRSVELPADIVERAATCGVVAAVDAREKTKTIKGPLSLEAQSRIIHYAMLTGAEGPEFSAARASAVVKLMPAIEGRITSRKWKTLIGPCGQAFPATVATGAVELPGDPLEAELGCNGVAAFVERAVQTPDKADNEQLQHYREMRTKLDDRIGRQLKQRGQGSFTEIQNARQKAMATAVKLGPPAEVMKACLARYA